MVRGQTFWRICGESFRIRGLGLRAYSRPGNGRDQLSACCTSLTGQAFSNLLRSTVLGHNQAVCSSSILPSNEAEVQADLAGRSCLHLQVTMMNDVLADEFSIKLPAQSLHASF